MIEFAGVTFRRSGSIVFEDLSVRILPETFVLLVGSNGTGKTSFLDLCSGLDTPDSGEVRVEGASTKRDTEAVRTTVGRVFENPRDQLIGETVGADVAFGPENLGWSRDDIDTSVRDALDVVGMGQRAKASIHRLSGGEVARVAVAGALAMQPDWLLLDEPTTGIDHPGRTQILDHLASLHAEGMGIVLATHDLRDLGELADRVMVCGERGIVEDGPPETLTNLSDRGVRIPHAWPD